MRLRAHLGGSQRLATTIQHAKLNLTTRQDFQRGRSRRSRANPNLLVKSFVRANAMEEVDGHILGRERNQVPSAARSRQRSSGQAVHWAELEIVARLGS